MFLRAILLPLVVYGCARAAALPSDGDPAPKGMVTASDSSYGYTEANPIKVGGASHDRGPQNQRAYLDALRGPSGERLRYHRVGSCCHFKTPNGLFANRGALDVYEVTYEGLAKPLQLYLNMYDYEQPKIPHGFTGSP